MKVQLPDVGTGYGDIGRPVHAFEGYRAWVQYSEEARQLVEEAGSTADFATYLDPSIQKTFFENYDREDSTWNQWTDVFDVPNFKAITSVGLGRFPRLIEVPEGGEYYDMPLAEITGPTIRVKKFGRRFSLTREMIINDDMNKMNDIPAMMGDTARETLDYHVVNALENPGTAYDGIAFFHASHNNLITDALSETSLPAAATKMRIQTDESGLRIGLKPGVAIIPPDLEMTMLRILNSSEITQAGTGSTPAYGTGNYNVARNLVGYVVEPKLTDANDWYIVAQTRARRPAFRVAFLMGMRQPQVMLRNPEMRFVLGGIGNADPYTMEFDEIWWKVRFEYAVAPWEWRSALKSAVA